jgi:hypothetical protein
VYAALIAAASASNGAASAESSGWEVRLTPYLWATSIEGEQGLGRLPDADIDIAFRDLFESIDFAAMGRVEAQAGPWTLFGDVFFATLGADAAFDVTFGPFTLGPVTVGPFEVGPRGRRTIGPFTFERIIGPFSETIEFDLKQDVDIYEFGAMYRVGEGSLGGQDRHWSVEVLGGARYTDVELRISSRGPFAVRSASVEEDWIDPIVGGQVAMDLTPKWELVARGDVGGFGVGSDFQWNVLGGLTYRFHPTTNVFLGYRALYQDYETGSGRERFLWDITQHGPLLALELTW